MDGFSPAWYNFRMKKVLAAILLLFLLIPTLCACRDSGTEPPDAQDIIDSAQPEETETAAAAYGHNAGVKITASAAYVFDGVAGATLYGAVEYENTGNCPIYISKANFTFTADGNTIEHEYIPVLGEYTVVLPGETSYEAVWVTGKNVSAGAAVTLAASLTAIEAAPPRVSLKADNLYAADNYPGFSTLSGRLSCVSEAGCSMNIVYVGFYDEAGAFLGAWYFSKNAVLEAGEAKNFVVNMQDFPLSDLGARAASFKSAAFGFDL